MESIRRRGFIQELQGRSYSVATLRQDAGMATIAVASADLNSDGKIDNPEELDALFTAIDKVDNDGDRNSVRTRDAQNSLTRPGKGLEAMRRLAAASTGPRSPYTDIALARTFTTQVTSPIVRGASGPRIVALQYALTRLGLLHSRVDGNFGGDTQRALTAFQTTHQLPVSGTLTHETLSAIDALVSVVDTRSTLARAADPFTILNDFSGLTTLTAFTGTPIDWNNASVQTQYRRFVGEYWPIMRDNITEMDCKTVSLLLVTQFRLMVKDQLQVTLPMPRSRDRQSVLPQRPWHIHTAERPNGMFQRINVEARPGYDAVRRVQALDPTQSMIYGVNLRNDGISADTVARVAQPIGATIANNGGDTTRPEVDVSVLQPGDMLLLNHNSDPNPPDRRFDHCVTVIGVERDADGRVRSLRLAVGSFDDMKDADSTTPPVSMSEINFYMEELVVRLDTNGRITGSETTWTSEPQGLMAPRYSGRNTLMELRAGGVIFAGRFGS